MPFKKGDAKPEGSGRRRGVKNRRPTLRSFRAALAEEGLDAADELVKLYRSTRDESLQFTILKVILEYSQTRPTTELQDEDGESDVEKLTDAQLLKLADGESNPNLSEGV